MCLVSPFVDTIVIAYKFNFRLTCQFYILYWTMFAWRISRLGSDLYPVLLAQNSIHRDCGSISHLYSIAPPNPKSWVCSLMTLPSPVRHDSSKGFPFHSASKLWQSRCGKAERGREQNDKKNDIWIISRYGWKLV